MRTPSVSVGRPTRHVPSTARRAAISTTQIARALPAVIFVVLLVAGALPFVLTAINDGRAHEMFIGAAGPFPEDQDQYLAYAASAHDGVIRNLYGTIGSRVFVDPVWSVSGLAEGVLGVSGAVVMGFWTLVSAIVLFAGSWRLVRRHIPASRQWSRSVALALALFGGMTLLAVMTVWDINDPFAAAGGDMVPLDSLWGYAPVAIAIGLMPFALEGMERAIDGVLSPAAAVGAIAACLLPGWLHPWQGVTLMLIWIGLLVWRYVEAGDRRLPQNRVIAALISVALLAGPLYFEVLPHIDHSWAVFNHADEGGFVMNWQYLVYAIGPAALVGAVGAWRYRNVRSARSLVLWPVAVLILMAARPPEVFHCLDGVALPLGVLAVLGWSTQTATSRAALLRCWRLVLVVYVGFALVSAVVMSRSVIGSTQNLYTREYTALSPDDARAIKLAAAHDDGQSILTSQTLGVMVPVVADAPTWVGDPFWTPNANGRTARANQYMLGWDSPATARRFVDSTRARAIVEPCGWPGRLTAELTQMGFVLRTVGCARVYWRAS